MRAAAPAGILYAIQTFRQIIPADSLTPLPCLDIEDWPHFPWRGFMLDEGRHFHGKDTVKLLLDLMLLQKLNVFHWHLSEDQGWRPEIRRYPDLTRIGSKRKGTMRASGVRPDGVPYEGSYSQEDIREIVAYAAARGITVVPEIDLPGHALSALASYPWLGCTGGPYEVWDRIGIQPEIMCAGKETTFEFLQGMLEEIIELFPGPWIHIGGDEAPKERWQQCPDCAARMRTLGLQDPSGLQTWMTNRVAAFLRSRGKGTITWNDSLAPDLDPEVRIQYWFRHRERLIDSIRHGRSVIGSHFWDCYLDHGYALTPLQRAYAYEPVLRELDAAAAESIVGIEAPLWTEMVPDCARLWYQTFPRLCAYAETGWTPAGSKDWKSFLGRLPGFLTLIRSMGGSHAPLREALSGPLRRLFGSVTLRTEQTGRA
jgi:hexosaminidase